MVLGEQPSGDGQRPAESTEQARARRCDVDAELAIGDGEREILASYFRDVVPSPEVLQGIASCLLGAGPKNQTLRFRKNGRPRKNKASAPVDAETAAVLAFSLGDERALALYLDAGTISDQVRKLLADAFNSGGSTKQKLVFEHNRAGNQATELGTELRMALLGHAALQLKERLGTWSKVDQELYDSNYVGSDDSRRKRAVHFVRSVMAMAGYASIRDKVQRAFEALGIL